LWTYCFFFSALSRHSPTSGMGYLWLFVHVTRVLNVPPWVWGAPPPPLCLSGLSIPGFCNAHTFQFASRPTTPSCPLSRFFFSILHPPPPPPLFGDSVFAKIGTYDLPWVVDLFIEGTLLLLSSRCSCCLHKILFFSSMVRSFIVPSTFPLDPQFGLLTLMPVHH